MADSTARHWRWRLEDVGGCRRRCQLGRRDGCGDRWRRGRGCPARGRCRYGAPCAAVRPGIVGGNGGGSTVDDVVALGRWGLVVKHLAVIFAGSIPVVAACAASHVQLSAQVTTALP